MKNVLKLLSHPVIYASKRVPGFVCVYGTEYMGKVFYIYCQFIPRRTEKPFIPPADAESRAYLYTEGANAYRSLRSQLCKHLSINGSFSEFQLCGSALSRFVLLCLSREPEPPRHVPTCATRVQCARKQHRHAMRTQFMQWAKMRRTESGAIGTHGPQSQYTKKGYTREFRFCSQLSITQTLLAKSTHLAIV